MPLGVNQEHEGNRDCECSSPLADFSAARLCQFKGPPGSTDGSYLLCHNSEWWNISTWKRPIKIINSNTWLLSEMPKTKQYNWQLHPDALSRGLVLWSLSWGASSCDWPPSQWRTFSWHPTWILPDAALFHSSKNRMVNKYVNSHGSH